MVQTHNKTSLSLILLSKGTFNVCGQDKCVRNPLFTIDGLVVIWVILLDFTLKSYYISYLISEKFFAN